MCACVCIFTDAFVYLCINRTKYAEKPLLTNFRAGGML